MNCKENGATKNMTDEKLTCKNLWGFGIENYPEDIKTKLILDYEKLYYRICDLAQYGNPKDHLIENYASKLQYIDYLFKYIYNTPIKKFTNTKKIEQKVKTINKARDDKTITSEEWVKICEENDYESVKEF